MYKFIIEIYWHLVWITEWMIDKTCPLQFKVWYFSHPWNPPHDTWYLTRVINNKEAFFRRWRLLTKAQQDKYIEKFKETKK